MYNVKEKLQKLLDLIQNLTIYTVRGLFESDRIKQNMILRTEQ